MNGSDVASSAGGERTVWSGRPSQWLNFKYYFVALLLIPGALFVALNQADSNPKLAVVGWVVAGLVTLVAFWQWLVVRCTEMVLTSQRLSVRQGVLSRRRNDLELYRVKDTALDEPLLLRLVSLGNIEIASSDRTHPTFVIRGIRDAEPVRQLLRSSVERLRDTKNVREVDME